MAEKNVVLTGAELSRLGGENRQTNPNAFYTPGKKLTVRTRQKKKNKGPKKER